MNLTEVLSKARKGRLSKMDIDFLGKQPAGAYAKEVAAALKRARKGRLPVKVAEALTLALTPPSTVASVDAVPPVETVVKFNITTVGTETDRMLAERGKRYGDFRSHAVITQNLKYAMQDAVGWQRLTASQKEALEMVAHKIGRILNGDPNYRDSWVDILGYTQLVVNELPA